MVSFLNFFDSWLGAVVPFLPIVVGLLVKSKASQKVKATIMIVVNGLASLAYQIDSGGGILTQAMFSTWIMSIVVSIAMYYGVWKPLGVGNLQSDKGVG